MTNVEVYEDFAQWTAYDGIGSAMVRLTEHTDHRGADGWEYHLTFELDGRTEVRIFDKPGELIFAPFADAAEVLRTLATFVSAWDEAVNYGVPTYGQSENADLFPADVTPFLAYVDEFRCDTMEDDES